MLQGGYSSLSDGSNHSAVVLSSPEHRLLI
jgi:hypothetical protein